MKRRIMLFMACLLVGVAMSFAQVSSVTGVVVAEEDGSPVIGASVLVKGTTVGTITDFDGNFTIPSVPEGAKTLVISYIGMQTREVGIKPEVTVSLASDTEVLDEVVVTGYGVQRKASFTGAASVVDDKTLSRKLDANFVRSLEGAVPGVQISNSSSMPGVWSEIYVP